MGTGAGGAGLVLEFLAHAAVVAAEGKVPVWPVTVVYACDSPALLRFVTNELLARKAIMRAPGVRIVTGLSSSSSSSCRCSVEAYEEEDHAQRLQQRQQAGCCSRRVYASERPHILGRLSLQVRQAGLLFSSGSANKRVLISRSLRA